MSGFVIVVDFKIKLGEMQNFRHLIDENAKASVRDEPGCRRFDVLADRKEADRILLYEIYANRAAFDAHMRTPHFAVFDRDSEALVADKRVTEYDLACEGSAA
jgi:quinol monooxygenase YgiN